MPSGSIPRPIVYALSIVIVLLGFAVSYQVFMGTSFSYESKLGTIQLGLGEDTTTLAEFVEQSQQALEAAKSAIASLEAENDSLREQIVVYRRGMQKIENTANANKESAVSSIVADSFSNLPNNIAARKSASIQLQSKLLDKQLIKTGKVRQLINSQIEEGK